MFDWLREMWKMRGLVRVRIVEKDKRAVPIEVTKFLNDRELLSPDPFVLSNIPARISPLDWVVREITYKPENKDTWNMPSETLMYRVGDCEDGAILTAAFMLARKDAPYYEILVNVFDTCGNGADHVAVTLRGKLMDWTRPDLHEVPATWKLSYCFNRKHSYTLKENADKWPKQ